jgi:2-dehydropantoate 2-reductase
MSGLTILSKENKNLRKLTKMKYLIVGTGGVGGNIAAFLALAGKDVTCIARGAHLEAIRQRGLKLISTFKGEHAIPIKACTTDEYNEKADVIFVCVKGYSLTSVTDFIKKAAHENTLVIPILNVYGTGGRIAELTGLKNVLDGCVYIVGFVSAPGEITQMGKVFRLVFGPRKGQQIAPALIESVHSDLVESGIKTLVSDDIDRDTFIKWSFISAMACTGAFYDSPMEPIQKPGCERDTFIGLSDESIALGRKLGIEIPDNQTELNLKVIDALAPESTASMQKDLEKGHQSEIDDLLFRFIREGRKIGLEMPTYSRVAAKFQNNINSL